MLISQRGTSQASITSSGYYNIDRFRTALNTGTVTTSQSTDAPTSEGFSRSFKVDVTTANTSLSGTNFLHIQQPIEGQNLQMLSYGTSGAKTITLSFFVKSNKTGIYCISLEKTDNTRYDYTAEYTISSANTWEKKTITIVPDSNIQASGGAIDNDNGKGLNLKFVLAAGGDRDNGANNTWNSSTPTHSTPNQVNLLDSTSNEFFLTGVQLEVGDTATSFEHISIAENKRRCYRYCQRGRHISSCLVGTPGTYYFSRGHINLFTPMRATVTGTLKAATWNLNRYFQYMTWSSGTNVTAAPASVTFSSLSISDASSDIVGIVLHISISSGSSNSPLPANGPGSNNVYPIEYYDVLLEAEL